MNFNLSYSRFVVFFCLMHKLNRYFLRCCILNFRLCACTDVVALSAVDAGEGAK